MHQAKRPGMQLERGGCRDLIANRHFEPLETRTRGFSAWSGLESSSNLRTSHLEQEPFHHLIGKLVE
jgi:hypothetical protein